MAPADPLGEFINRNQDAWNQRQANYDQSQWQKDQMYGLGGMGASLNGMGGNAGLAMRDWSDSIDVGIINAANSLRADELAMRRADESRVVKDWNPDDLPEREGYMGRLLADASDVMDKMGQPLTGSSNYNAFRKFGEIVGGIPQRPLTTTFSQLADWATYTVPDAQQRAAEITGRYVSDPRFATLDRALASPLGGAAYGIANILGVSPETQELVLGVGSAADGLLLSAAAIKGGVPSFLGAQRPGVMDVQSPYALTSNNYLSDISRLVAGEVRFSQSTVSFQKLDRSTGQAFTYDNLVSSMKIGGWKGAPVDVVRMPDGRLTSIDNTRIMAAREVGVNVQANVRAYNAPLTAAEVGRFSKAGQVPTTWGDAVRIRIESQSSRFSANYPYGADPLPRVTGRPKP